MNVSVNQGPTFKPLNRATTRLIQGRCEREVRSGILRWTGLPIGGTGALAFLGTLLVWIPQQIQNADLGELGHDIVRSYVETAITGNPEFQSQLDTAVRVAVKESAAEEVTVQIQRTTRERVDRTLTLEVTDAVAEAISDVLRSPAMEAQVSSAVAEVLQPDNYQALRTVVVESTKRRLLETVHDNAEQAIETVANPLGEDQIIDKSTYEQLREQIQTIVSRGLPAGDFALRFYVAAETGEDHGYDPYFIADYLTELGGVLGDQFRYVLILDRRSRFVALVTVEWFRAVMQAQGYGLTDVLNDGNKSLAWAEEELQRLLGRESSAYLDASVRIGEALRSETLESAEGQIAVLEDASTRRRFQGVTSRRRLLSALLP